MSQEVKVVVETKDNNEVIIRTGLAEVIHEPVPVHFVGYLHSPSDYMLNKSEAQLIAANYCRLEVSYEKMQIDFIVNAHNKFRDTIGGKLIPAKIIKELGINCNAQYGDKQLAKLLRRYAFYFADQSSGSSLIHRLMNFEAKITTNIVAKDDLRGNTKKAIEKLIDNEMPEFVVFNLPVFEGAEPQPIKVYLLADTSGTGVSFYFDSPELYMLELTESKKLIDAEIEKFKAFGCAIICC